jgi:transcriptional regulator with XRE-family HTH domain
MAISNPLQGNPDGAELRKGAGQYVKQLREAVPMTQQELAKAVGMDYYTTISQIERGQTRVPPDKIEPFAAALQVDPKTFAQRLLMYYDPHTWKILFGKPR